LKRLRIPVAVLALQAGLLFAHLGMLPLWSDELFTVYTVGRPIRDILAIVAQDIHPPLYYILLHLWPVHSVTALRAFSACWALAATLLLDLFWTAHWRPWRRFCTMLLLALSPCLLLYARMARSYSMQMALFLLAASLLWRWLRLRRGAVPACAACLALLYTHYVPGLALLAAFALVALPRLGPRRVAMFAGAIALAYGPWLWTLAGALQRWGQAADFFHSYRLTGNFWLEQVLKMGYGAVSLSIGESFYAVVLLLVPWVAWLLFRGLKRAPGRLAAMISLAAAIGYLGVARWVSYPFIPARLLWLLPFLTLAVAAGTGRHPIPAAVLLLASLSSVFCYFRQENYLNKGYQAPVRELARRLHAEAGSADLILADAFNTDAGVLAYYLGPGKPLQVMTPQSEAALASLLAPARTVWIVRNQRDISPGAVTTRIESLACAARVRQETDYLPYNGWQRLVLAHLVPHPPTHFYQLTRCSTE
jgi:hypothetical protein